MNNSTRYFFFFLILLVGLNFTFWKMEAEGDTYYYPLLLSIVIPLIIFPIYKSKKNIVSSSKLFNESEQASLYSKIGFILGGVSGFVYSTMIIDVCAGFSSSSWCYSIVGIFVYTVGSAFGGFVLGALVGLVSDFSKSKKI